MAQTLGRVHRGNRLTVAQEYLAVVNLLGKITRAKNTDPLDQHPKHLDMCSQEQIHSQ